MATEPAPPPAAHQVAAHAHGTLCMKVVTVCGLIATVGGPALAKLSPVLGAQSAVVVIAGAVIAAAGAIGHALVDHAFLGATDNG